jgi:hypothetical protein
MNLVLIKYWQQNYIKAYPKQKSNYGYFET